MALTKLVEAEIAKKGGGISGNQWRDDQFTVAGHYSQNVIALAFKL